MDLGGLTGCDVGEVEEEWVNNYLLTTEGVERRRGKYVNTSRATSTQRDSVERREKREGGD